MSLIIVIIIMMMIIVMTIIIMIIITKFSNTGYIVTHENDYNTVVTFEFTGP